MIPGCSFTCFLKFPSLPSKVRSAIQILQAISRQNVGGGDGGGDGGPSDGAGNCYNSSGRLGSGTGNGAVANFMEATRMLPLCRSSPSVFVSCGDSRSSSSPARHRYRHASTQTDQPINVPVAVLEAFVLAHRPRVLQLLGIQEVVEEPASPSAAGCGPLGSPVAPAGGSSPPTVGAARKCSVIAGSSNSNSSSRSLESTGADEESLAAEDPADLHTVSAQNPSISIQSASPAGEPRNNNNNKTANTQIETYQLTNIQNWNPNPQFQRTAISGSRSIGSLKDILSSASSKAKSHAHQFHIQENDGSASQIHCHSDHSDPNNPLVHYGCASDCPSKDLMYFSEINHAMTRSTSMPVASFRYSPYPSSASLSSKPPLKREADAAERGAALAETVLLPNTTVETRANSSKPSYVTDF